MSKQLTVRLADDLVGFVDERVRRGEASSRAAVITAALDRERRRMIALRDVAILTGAAEKDDFHALAEYAARTASIDLD